MQLELRHLRLVQAISEEGGVTRAGRRLHLSQSALSHQLREAEARLGAPLFGRIGKRMVLTPAGERMLELARRVLPEIVELEQGLRRDVASGRGVLRLATQCNTVYHWLPSRLRLFHRRWREVDVEVIGVADDPLPALLEGRIDLAIVQRSGRHPRVTQRPLFDDELVVVAPAGHRLAARPFVAARDFVGERLLVYSAPREANAVFRDVLIPAGVEPARVVQIQLTEAIVELVAAGLGISVLPRWSVAPQIERGTLVARPLTRAGRFRAWSAAYRSRPAPPPHLLGFVEVLARHPLPVGRTRDERKRIAASLVTPA
jgi:LysR family transcriptional regulator for metE and metH